MPTQYKTKKSRLEKIKTKKPNSYQIKFNQKTYNSIYSEKYNIYILSRYPKKDDEKYEEKIDENEEETDEKESPLESLIGQSEDETEEKLESEKKDSKIISLENVLKQNRKNNYKNPLNSYLSYLNLRSYSSHKEPQTGAKVFYVSPSYLPKNVLGMYVPSNHAIYIANNLSEREKRFVYYHEIAHAKGIRNENQADAYATSIVGYNLRNAA